MRKQAVKMLRLAQKSEGETPVIYKNLARAYAQLGDIPRAELATAEAALLQGDRKLAIEKAKAAQTALQDRKPRMDPRQRRPDLRQPQVRWTDQTLCGKLTPCKRIVR